MFRLLIQFVTVLVSIARWRVAVSAGLVLMVGLTEGASVLLLVPLLHLVGIQVQGGTVGSLAQLLSSAFALVHLRPSLGLVLFVYALVSTVQALLVRQQQISNAALQAEFSNGLRQRLYRAIASTDWLFFLRSRSSDFVHALTAETDRAAVTIPALITVMADSLMAVIYLAFAVHLSALLTGFILGSGGVLLLLTTGRMRASNDAGQMVSESKNELYAAIMEHLAGMKTAKTLDVQERHIALFTRMSGRVAEMNDRAIRGYADSRVFLDVGSVVLLCLTLFLAVRVIGLSTAGVILLLFLFARLVPRLTGLQQKLQISATILPSFANVMDMQARCEAAAEPTSNVETEFHLDHAVRFRDVSFQYDANATSPTVTHLDLSIPIGQTIAIVGPSGAGKSTLADLVTGLIVPDAGAVLVDEAVLQADISRAWRRQLGYVGQDTFLLHDTIRANLLWSCPDASDADIKHALNQAAAYDFVANLGQGLDTIVGDRGVRLSGGERQRLSLARALLRRPALLILDEATSAVDSENERRIQSAIEALHGRTTILVIAHRLSTVHKADCIYVLERGEVVEHGSWNELLADTNSRFTALCKAQSIDVTARLWEPVGQ